jgi:hypothetical protein
LRCYFVVILLVSKAWVLHFYAGLVVFANALGGADYVGGSRPEASGRALASTSVNPEDRDEHHRE